jgi:hypothetical protein
MHGNRLFPSKAWWGHVSKKILQQCLLQGLCFMQLARKSSITCWKARYVFGKERQFEKPLVLAADQAHLGAISCYAFLLRLYCKYNRKIYKSKYLGNIFIPLILTATKVYIAFNN